MEDLDAVSSTEAGTDGDTQSAEEPSALLGGACGGPDTYWEAGQRLRPIVHEPEDGAPTLAGWFDTELGADCAFEVASDGVLRCLPGDPHAVFVRDDARCERSIAVTHDGEARDLAVVEGCSGAEVFALGPLVEGPTQQDLENGCSSPSAYQVVLEPIAPESFVAVATEVESSSAELQRQVFRTEDGACAYGAAWDGDGGGALTVGPDEGGVLRFVPSFGRAASLFGDLELYGSADCTGRRVGQDSCDIPELAAENLATCGFAVTRQQFYSTGESVEPDTVYRLDESCSPDSPLDDSVSFYLGDVVEGASLRAAVTLLEDGRLQRQIHAAEEGARLQVDPAYWDSELGTRCTPREGRCEPSTGLIVRFADDACTEPRIVYSPSQCGELPTWAVSNTSPAEFYEVASDEPVASSGTLHVRSGSDCVRAVDLEPDEIVLPAAGPVDSSVFAVVDRVVE